MNPTIRARWQRMLDRNREQVSNNLQSISRTAEFAKWAFHNNSNVFNGELEILEMYIKQMRNVWERIKLAEKKLNSD